MTTKQRESMVRRLEREWQRAIRREEESDTVEQAHRRAAASDRAMARLQAARAGVTLPVPRTALNMAKAGFAALATIGKVVAKSMVLAERLRAAQAVNAARRSMIKVSTTTYGAMRRAVSAVVRCLMTATQEVTVFFRTGHRDPSQMKVRTVRYSAPAVATYLELVEMAHQAGATNGHHTLAGVFELRTEVGVWSCPGDAKLMTRSHSGLSPRATFRVVDEQAVAS